MCAGRDAQILAGIVHAAPVLVGERSAQAAPVLSLNPSLEEAMHRQAPTHVHSAPGKHPPAAGPAPRPIARRLQPALTRAVLAIVALASAALAASPASAQAANTYFVAPHGSDTVACAANSAGSPFKTIQRAIVCAANGDTVSLAPSGKTPYPGIGTVADSITVEAQAGANARDVEIAASSADLGVRPGASVTVSGVTLTCVGGECKETVKEATVGSPVVVNAGTLTLSADTITDDVNAHTAAIENIPLEDSSTPATLNVLDSTVSGNGGGAFGGGIASRELEREGIRSSGALSVNVVNSTIAENDAAGKGAGLALEKPTTASIVGSTITANVASNGGGVFVESGARATIANTIIAGNKTGKGGTQPDCDSSLTDEQPSLQDGPGGHNLIGDADGCLGPVSGIDGDQLDFAGAGLLTLADNGGPTDTVALQAGSPAIGGGDPATCEDAPIADLDQRGEPRHTSTRGCDIGAYDTGGAGGAVHATYYVAPSGAGAGGACSANSKSMPFATIQEALACAVDGDVVKLAPSGSTPYPGIGAVAANVTIEAGSGASARNVEIDDARAQLEVEPEVNATVAGATLTCTGEVCLHTVREVIQTAPTVRNEGTLTLSADTVSGNLGDATGAIENLPPEGSSTPATLNLTDSTVSGNQGGTTGGAILSRESTLSTGALAVNVINSTIADNASTDRGGGVALQRPTNASIVNSTITANSTHIVGGGLDVEEGATALLENTIIAGNSGGANQTEPDCVGGSHVLDGPGGHNLIGVGSGCESLLNGVDGDHVGTAGSPLEATLGPLGYDGGTTPTAPPLPGSPAIGAGDAITCETVPVAGVDQRGQPRNAPARNACDVGADDTGGNAETTISSISPSSVVQGAKKATLTIAGSGFLAPAKVTVSAPAKDIKAKVTGVTASALALTLKVAASTPVGAYEVTVENGNGASVSCSACLSVTAAG